MKNHLIEPGFFLLPINDLIRSQYTRTPNNLKAIQDGFFLHLLARENFHAATHRVNRYGTREMMRRNYHQSFKTKISNTRRTSTYYSREYVSNKARTRAYPFAMGTLFKEVKITRFLVHRNTISRSLVFLNLFEKLASRVLQFFFSYSASRVGTKQLKNITR